MLLFQVDLKEIEDDLKHVKVYEHVDRKTQSSLVTDDWVHEGQWFPFEVNFLHEGSGKMACYLFWLPTNQRKPSLVKINDQ